MIRTYFFYFVLVSYLLLSGFAYLWYLFIGLFGKKYQYRYLHKMTASWGRLMVALSSSKVELVDLYKLPEGNVLYVSNHQSYYDIPLLLGYLPKPKAYVAKIELSKVPLISHWMRVMGCLFLDRGNLKQSLKVILQGVEDLKNGKTLVIFPEGTRSKSYTMAEFRKGSLKLGIKAGVPIVPITIDGSFKMYEAKKAITKDHVRIIVHDPIYPHLLSKEEQDNLSETVRGIIMAPIADLQ
ncbi:MAG: 1-acyl-sn-glycerol-3-phosphate acyltransferase [Firmicutes bacterium HGW-Firmicutes-5]|nr:MAG: 1-acyl-sn-glycerol-3-phosphate acyltransferase [Firmicutes bacterium HGW-Firmicutes-5]